jgi:hypothetical protein
VAASTGKHLTKIIVEEKKDAHSAKFIAEFEPLAQLPYTHANFACCFRELIVLQRSAATTGEIQRGPQSTPGAAIGA